MNTIDLSKLPRKYGVGANKDKQVIDWESSKGCVIPCVYKDDNLLIKIKDYKTIKSKLIIGNDDVDSFEISTGNLLKCKLGGFIRNIPNYKYKVGQTLTTNTGLIRIIECKKQSLYGNAIENTYKFECLKCGYSCGSHMKGGNVLKELWISEHSLDRGYGCSCCVGLVAVLGINTIWDTHRFLIDNFGLDEEFAKKYTFGTREKGKFICKSCNKVKEISPLRVIYSNSIGCICNSGYYPEKFMDGILNQLDINFKTQLTKTDVEWCDKYRYDFYLHDYNMIIETHGMQHYRERSKQSNFKRTLQEEQLNDKLKRELALKNGIEHYIVVDCRYSELEYIRNSILKSELNELFDLSKIDWEKANLYAIFSNKKKEAWEYWNSENNNKNISKLANKLKLKNDTIRRYLRLGDKLGMCEYKVYNRKGGVDLNE